jgi:hypothetical protein
MRCYACVQIRDDLAGAATSRRVGKGAAMDDEAKGGASRELRERLNAMSRGRKIVLIVFIIWAIQAVPKWTAAIVADGETSAAIMRFFIEPR